MSGENETKERLRPVSLFLILLSLSFQTVAVVMGKTAALRMHHPTLSAFLMSPWYVGGLVCLVLQALTWQMVLREVKLFVAYLITSLNYFLVLAASRIFFLERVSSANILGATIIVAGVYIVIREDLP